MRMAERGMRGWQANLIGVGVAGAVVAAGMLAGSDDARANGPSHPMRLAAPPASSHGTRDVPLGDALQLWGEPARVDLFWTTDSVNEVARTYVDAWKAAGFDAQVHTIDAVTSVAALDTHTGLMRSVTILSSGDERVVLPGLTDMRVLPDTSPAGAPVPIPETAHAYIASSADDTTSISYNGTYMVPLKPERTIAFYRVEMGQRGYAEVSKPDLRRVHNGLTVEFTRGQEWVRVVASGPDKAKVQAAQRAGEIPEDANGESSFVTVTHVRRLDRPEGSP